MTFATCTSGSAPLISPCAYTPSLAVSHPQSPLVCAINCAEQQRRFPRTSPKVRVRRRRRRRLDFSATRSARQVKSRVTWSSRIAWPRTRVTCRRRSTSSSKSDACSARFDHITSENPRTEEAAPFPCACGLGACGLGSCRPPSRRDFAASRREVQTAAIQTAGTQEQPPVPRACRLGSCRPPSRRDPAASRRVSQTAATQTAGPQQPPPSPAPLAYVHQPEIALSLLDEQVTAGEQRVVPHHRGLHLGAVHADPALLEQSLRRAA